MQYCIESLTCPAFYTLCGMAGPDEVSRLLHEWAQGNEAARDQLVPLVYDALRRLAARYVSNEQQAVTMQPTVLVHEAYLRLVGHSTPAWESRNHFFGVAAHLMRQILVDAARARSAGKRGGGVVKVDLEMAETIAPNRQGADVIALSDAMDALARLDARKASIIELRHFGGFTEAETARSLGISVATVQRDTRIAETWLHAEMSAPRK